MYRTHCEMCAERANLLVPNTFVRLAAGRQRLAPRDPVPPLSRASDRGAPARWSPRSDRGCHGAGDTATADAAHTQLRDHSNERRRIAAGVDGLAFVGFFVVSVAKSFAIVLDALGRSRERADRARARTVRPSATRDARERMAIERVAFEISNPRRPGCDGSW
jgi:hypothetical protein